MVISSTDNLRTLLENIKSLAVFLTGCLAGGESES